MAFYDNFSNETWEILKNGAALEGAVYTSATVFKNLVTNNRLTGSKDTDFSTICRYLENALRARQPQTQDIINFFNEVKPVNNVFLNLPRTHSIFTSNYNSQLNADPGLQTQTLETQKRLNSLKRTNEYISEKNLPVQMDMLSDSDLASLISDAEIWKSNKLDAEIEQYFNDHNIIDDGTPDNFYQKLHSQLTDVEQKEDFSFSLHAESFFHIKLVDESVRTLNEFISAPADTYPGMSSTDITLVQYSRSLRECNFIDPYYINAQPNPKDTFDQETSFHLLSRYSKTLMTGCIDIVDGMTEPASLLKDTLQLIKDSGKFDKVIIPIGCHEGENRHSIALVIESQNGGSLNKALIVDQLGNSSPRPYDKTKTAIADTLAQFGFQSGDIQENKQPLTALLNGQNRNDCATITSMVMNAALNDNLQDFIQNAPHDNAEVDNWHADDQAYAKEALYDICRQNPLFRLWLKANGYTSIYEVPADQRQTFCMDFQNNLHPQDQVTQVDELEPPTRNLAWKDDVNSKFVPVAARYQRPFNRMDNVNEPLLRYELSDSKITYQNTGSVLVESNKLDDFMIICETSKELGRNTISFGNFTQHPEYKAMLYLACLKTGMKMKNAPDLDSLRAYPQEYTQIQQLLAQKEQQERQAKIVAYRPKMTAAREQVKQAQETCDNDSTYLIYKSELDRADKEYRQKKKNNAPQAEIDAAFAARSQAEAKLYDPAQCPAGHALQQARQAQEAVLAEGLELSLGAPDSPGYAERLTRWNNVANRRLAPLNQDLKQNAGESDDDYRERLADKLLEKLARKPQEEEADYQARKTKLKQKMQTEPEHNPLNRIKDKKINENRKVTQTMLKNVSRGR